MSRFIQIAAFLFCFAFANLASAEIPFTREAFKKAQDENKKIVLVFFADWCPTCKAQKKVLDKLEKEGFFKDILVFNVNYDKETELKKEMGVTQQSTLVTYYGAVFMNSASGLTQEEAIKNFISSNLSDATLHNVLKAIRINSAAKIPPEKAKVIETAIEKLKKSKLEEKALKVGQKMPEFSLKDAHGKKVQLKDLVKKGPVIVTFYRGSWCPYCNAQLGAYQEHLKEFTELGATLVAITPEKPDLTVLTEEKKSLKFPILTDENNALAKKFGLVWALDKDIKKVYKDFGIDLEKDQGNKDWKLPVPATFIVDKDRVVRYAFVDPDYTVRALPSEIIAALKKK